MNTFFQIPGMIFWAVAALVVLYFGIPYIVKLYQKYNEPTITVHKFRIGDNVKTINEEPLTITKIDDKGYWSGELFICDFDEDVCWDLVR